MTDTTPSSDVTIVRKASWRSALRIVAVVAIAALSPAGLGAEASPAPRPNFLVIVADDMGYSDIGAFGGEIATPNLDRLARAGVRFTDFHTAPACSPTRAMLLTGADNHEVGLGAFFEVAANRKPGGEGYQGFLTAKAATIAQRLRAAGYHTLMTGKWHLGLEDGQSPADHGFERSYALLQGAANHYGLDQEGGLRTLGGHSIYREDGRRVRYPQGRYSSDFYTTRLIDYLDQSRGDGKPFFAYLAFTAPHSPLQAPPEDIAKYRGRYDAGYEAIRADRLRRMKALGVVPPATTPHPLEDEVKPWAGRTPQDRAESARKMEVYAAMVDRMDQNVGRMLQHLRKTGQLRNTVILFLSDNGAATGTAVRFTAPDSMGRPVPVTAAEAGYDNSVANFGAGNSYISYGAEWAAAASAPFRLYKGSTSEGGIRTTALMSGPGVPRGRTSGAFLHVMDLAPTLLEFAGVRGSGAGAVPIRGKSLLPVLTQARREVRTPDEPVGWELHGDTALRMGKWKVVYLGGDHAAWQLYDLSKDPGETTDLGVQDPERLKAMVGAFFAYAEATGTKPWPGETWPRPEAAVEAARRR